mmetsp:Transcript_62498/g.116170  ORF Transcript_62498/g.116170 Transcript_62498/m.116170 type:complete len:434 (+) Transcript_62498:74-1375(+)
MAPLDCTAARRAGGAAASAAGQPASSRMRATAINLTKNLIGAGMFTMPKALVHGSVISGIGMLLFVGTVQGGTFVLIAFLCEKLKAKSYHEMMAKSLGPAAGVAVSACIATNSFFACTSYLVLVADFLQKALEGLFGWQDVSRAMLIFFSSIVPLVLSHARNLEPLKYTSMMGLVIIALVFAYVCLTAAKSPGPVLENWKGHAFGLNLGLFSTLALSTGAFQAHYNAPRIYNEVGGRLDAHITTVRRSFGIAFCIYAAFALSGFGLHGKEVHGNVLKSFDPDDICILLAWLGMAFSIIFTFPLVLTTGRDALISIVPPLTQASKRSPTATHVSVTCSMVCTIVAMACCVEDVSIVTRFLGATVGASLCWIYPACAYLAVAAPSKSAGLAKPLLQKNAEQKVVGPPWLKVSAYGMIVVGALSMSVGLADTFGFL